MGRFATSLVLTFGHARQALTAAIRSGRRPAVFGAAFLLAASAATVWGTANTPATITSLTVTPSVVDEGQMVTLRLAFTDPDVMDLHVVKIRWNDGTPKQYVPLQPGTLTLQTSHTYADNTVNVPQIWLAVYDHQDPLGSNDNAPGGGGHVFGTTPIQVRNVPPRFTVSSIVGAATAGGVVVEGDFTDPGSLDTHQLTGAVGNAIYPPGQSPMTCTISGQGNRHFRCQYSQQPNLQPRTYNVNLTIRDDDGGQGTHAMSVRFNGITRP